LLFLGYSLHNYHEQEERQVRAARNLINTPLDLVTSFGAQIEISRFGPTKGLQLIHSVDSHFASARLA
jgi:hypothetical protein